MASERRKEHGKLNCDFTKFRNLDYGVNSRENDESVKIYIHDNGAFPPEVDEKQFEHLKNVYFKQCQSSNMNMIRKLNEKRTASNNNFQDSAICSNVFGRGADIPVQPRDRECSYSNGGKACVFRDHSCAKYDRRHN